MFAINSLERLAARRVEHLVQRKDKRYMAYIRSLRRDIHNAYLHF